jgi:beta-xylosidase
MNPRLIPAPIALAFLMIASAVYAQSPVADKYYLFSSFRDNGEDGLHLAASTDGYHFTALNNDKTFMAPQVGKEKLVRDPCILQGPGGIFQMVWTDSWSDHTIGYSHSTDLIHWSDQVAIPVMGKEPTAMNCWAPEITYDAARRQYMIFFSTTIPGRFPETDKSGDKGYNHRVYSVTSSDLINFSDPKLLLDPGFNCIDATILPAMGKFFMIFKDETLTPPHKYLCMAESTDVQGPYTNVTGPFTRTWVEGPTAIKIGDDYVVYYDCYRDHHYGAVRSKDLKTWEDITDKISLPPGMRHGTVFQVSSEVVKTLIAEVK